MRSSRLDGAARNLIKYFQKRAKRGHPEARRDWLYGPAHIPPGMSVSQQEGMLDEVIRRAKDIGAEMEPKFELVYVYWRPPVWTCQPSEHVRDKAQEMELKRQVTAHERWERIAPIGSHNESLANASGSYLETARRMLRVPADEPAKDPVLARIDHAGMAN